MHTLLYHQPGSLGNSPNLLLEEHLMPSAIFRGWKGPPPRNLSFLSSRGPSGKTMLENFTLYLQENGVEVLAPTNEWEVLRFKCAAGTGIIYSNKSKFLTWCSLAEEAWLDYKEAIKFRYNTNSPRAKLVSSKRGALICTLLDRDGPNCVICDRLLELKEEQHPRGPITIEHLLDRKLGGSDHIANLALAHSTCNSTIAQVSSLREKIEKIIAIRKDLV